MTNGFDPKTFDFKKQTSEHNLQTAGSGIAKSWQHLWQLGKVKPWQMKYDEDDIRVAELAGASPYGLQQLLTEAKSRGLEIGKNTTKQINALRASQPEAFKAPINYGALGGYGFDTDDIKAMWGTGFEDKTSKDFTDALQGVRNAWTWAQDQNLPNSSGVDTWIHNKENEQRTAIQNKENEQRIAIETAHNNKVLEQQMAVAAEQARIQEEMAARAARVKGNSPTGVGGNATFRGSRLSITEAGGRKGTRRFSRPGTQFMDTLNSGNTAGTTTKSTLNL